MKLGLVINDIRTEHANYTTVGLGLAATRAGHEAWFINVSDFTYDPAGGVVVHARAAPDQLSSNEEYLKGLMEQDAQRIDTAELDVLFLRHDPAEEAEARPWATYSPILFGQLAARANTVVLNDPKALASALNKTYFQQFPEVVRPRTLISRNRREIQSFIEQEGGTAVLKPLQGSGGKNVFVVRNGETGNLNQIVEVISEHGYVVVQEYLQEGAQGDVRLFVMNGEPLCVDGCYAALRRINGEGDIRSNIHAGGRPEPVEVTDEMLALVETVRPKLVKDGMFLVGLDIVGDRLMEVNVFTPGGLSIMSEMYGIDFFAPVIAALERKANARRHYLNSMDNIDLATL